MSTAFPNLFSPIKIGPMEIKNRIALAPMANYMSDDEGVMNEPQIAFNERRARGGVGLLIVGSMYVQHPAGRFGVGQLGIYDDKLIPGYVEMLNRCHAHGAKVAAQLHHAGRATSSAAIQGLPPVAPSPIPLMIGKYVDRPRELSKADIEEIVKLYGDGARRAVEAGFDAIEIHMAHGYLPMQFMSRFSNKRSDEYGGDIQGRTRFAREVLQSVKAAAGPNIPVWVRIVGNELQGEAGIQLEDAKQNAQILVGAGAQAVSVSQGMAPYYWTVMDYHFDQGCIVEYAEAVKSVVTVPVFTAGRILEPAFAEDILAQGRADVVGLGRALICDPDWPNKAMESRVDDIRPCIGCNVGCHDPKRPARHTLCLSNAECGREGQFDILPASTPKRVLVVGGGPAGLEAARIARERGHDVTLADKNERLGGQLYLGSIPPDKEEIAGLIDWWERQIKKAGVKIELGKQITPDNVCDGDPDVVVVATGGRAIIPPIPGVERSNVVTAHAVLDGAVATGEHVVVVGGGETGAETAELLVHQGKTVTVVEMLEDIGLNVPPDAQYFIKQILKELNVRVLTSTVVTEIGDRWVTLTRNGDQNGLKWTAKLEPVDTVVLAVGIKPERALADAIAGKVPQMHVVGDATTPGNAMAAVHQAAILAREI